MKGVNAAASENGEKRRRASALSWRIAAIGFLGGIGGGVVFPVLPVLGERMGLSAFMIGVILAANRVVRIGVNPVTGALTDRYGGREVIAVGLFIEGVGTLGYIAALHFALPEAWFLAGRVVWGVGSSLLFVGAVATVLGFSTTGDRGRLVARTRSAISLGAPAGLVFGGLVTDFFSADAAFSAAMVLSIVAGIAAFACLPGRVRRETAAGASVRDRFGLRDWLALILRRRLAGIWLYAALVFFSTQGLLLATLVLLLQRRSVLLPGLGAEGSAGVLMAVLMSAYAGTSVAIGRGIDLVGRRTALLVPTVCLLVAGFASLAFSDRLGWTLASLVVIGCATGAVTIPLLALIGDLVAPEHRGRATAVYQVAADFGGTAGPILGLVLGFRYGFMPVYLGIAGLFMLTLPVAFLLMRAEARMSKIK